MKFFLILIIAIGFCVTDFSQESQTITAGEILNKAKREALGSSNSLQSVYINASSRFRTRKRLVKLGYISEYDLKIELWANQPNQLKYDTLYQYDDGGASLKEVTVSGCIAETITKTRQADEVAYTPALISERGDPEANRKRLANETRYRAFSLGFPIFYFELTKLKFKYLGVAKAGKQRAYVLETTLEGDYEIKLYFDKKTYQIVLMVANFFDTKLKEQIEHKYFFSDYKKEKRLVYAHKIIVHENGEIIEERKIVNVEKNASLESGFFLRKKQDQ